MLKNSYSVHPKINVHENLSWIDGRVESFQVQCLWSFKSSDERREKSYLLHDYSFKILQNYVTIIAYLHKHVIVDGMKHRRNASSDIWLLHVNNSISMLLNQKLFIWFPFLLFSSLLFPSLVFTTLQMDTHTHTLIYTARDTHTKNLYFF